MRTSIRELRAIIAQALQEADVDTGPFKKGDAITFGKYKNKRGKIKDTYLDDKDHVAVTIEPQPKGRKSDVEMSLYKVWPDDREEKK